MVCIQFICPGFKLEVYRSGNIRIKKPSDHVLDAISERAASMANVYKAMKLSGTEGRLLFVSSMPSADHTPGCLSVAHLYIFP